MDWLSSTLQWYFYLLVIGIVFYPLTKQLFNRFFDHGYPFSKTLGIIVISYLALFLGGLHLFPFTKLALYGLLIVSAGLNFYVFWRDKDRLTLKSITFNKLFAFIFEEILFLLALIFLSFVRGQEPSIHGLEKFMDFGFMNSILRSTHFPPLDMWYSAGPDLNGVEHAQGFPINYYYFGHLTGAMLIKLSGISPFVGYNLILATIFAQGITLTFSLVANIIHIIQKSVLKKLQPVTLRSYFNTYVFGLLGSFILNLAGNLHTIYLFTKGYPNDTPQPFWKILSSLNPSKYWYPNATRFIPFTIHEFPSYSYVVADLHGHVFDIPFVLLTLATLFHLFYSHFADKSEIKNTKKEAPLLIDDYRAIPQFVKSTVLSRSGFLTIFLGVMCAVHYMTNAFDGPIYLLLTLTVLFFIYRFSYLYILHGILLLITYLLISLPFTSHFSLFVSGVGVNCSPDFLFTGKTVVNQTATFKIGPFLFEKGNCQKSAPWMMFILWGFFWTNFLIFLILKLRDSNILSKLKQMVLGMPEKRSLKATKDTREYNPVIKAVDVFVLIVFTFSTLLLFIPEFFYVKDIYPAHFRANTMFKLGYQAFMMMSIASTYVIFRVKSLAGDHPYLAKLIALSVFAAFLFVFQTAKPPDAIGQEGLAPEYLFLIPLMFLIFCIAVFGRKIDTILSFIFIYILANITILVSVYPFFSFPSYYTNLQRKVSVAPTTLDGLGWLRDMYPEDVDLVYYINKHISGQPVILEAQGDSYTDYERISANTGIPTVAGWWVHEWLWRGTSDVVGKRIPDISVIYESEDIPGTLSLLYKYHVKYVVVSPMEKKKYPRLNEEKLKKIGKKIYSSKNGFGALYKLN